MSELLIPGETYTQLYHLDDEKKRLFKNDLGEVIRLRSFQSKRKISKPSLVLSHENAQIAYIYLPKVYNGNYGFGHYKKSYDLVIIEFISVDSVDLTVIRNGWLYYDILIFHHINNKIKK